MFGFKESKHTQRNCFANITHFLPISHVVINPLREKLNVNLKEWNTSRTLLSNLKALLDLEFPSPLSGSKEVNTTPDLQGPISYSG